VADDRVDEAGDADAVEDVAEKPQRPTIAPDVIVEQVSANANWNTQNASSGTPVVSRCRAAR
jgi:hypothetical protein